MPIDLLLMQSRIRDYTVEFVKDCNFIVEYCDKPNVIFIVDKNVWDCHNDVCLGLLKNQDMILLEANEERKCLEGVTELYDQIMERSPKKNLTVVSIGGGITQDITGFLVSTLY